jgi:hypothetical protein
MVNPLEQLGFGRCAQRAAVGGDMQAIICSL